MTTDQPDDQRRIDRDSSQPLYHQLEQIIRHDIDSGRYEPGDLLPSESDIRDRYDVSRSVVRQTIQNLGNAGLVRTERGRGSFVAEKKLSERFVQRTTGFYEDLTRMGLDIETRILAQLMTPVPLEVHHFLDVESAIRIDRLRAVEGRVLTYVVTYIPEAHVPGLLEQDLTDRSLYAHLEEVYDLKVHSGVRTVEAVPASPDVAGHLEVDVGTPLLLLRSAGRTRDGEPLEWFDSWHRADRTRFEVEIVPGEASRPFQQKVIADSFGAQLKVTDPTAADPLGESAGQPSDAGHQSSVFRQRLDIGRVVAVVRAPSYGDGGAIADALVEGGIELVEFTLTGSDALSVIEHARRLGNAVVVGAGSVLTPQDARRAVDAGAQFLVSPARISGVVRAAGAVPVVLGAFTPSEVIEAHALTDGPVKLFPAASGGTSHLSALAGPLPHVPLMPSGGVDADNVADWLAAGAVAVNAGSSLCPVDAVLSGDWAELTRRARRLRSAVDRVAGS